MQRQAEKPPSKEILKWSKTMEEESNPVYGFFKATAENPVAAYKAILSSVAGQVKALESGELATAAVAAGGVSSQFGGPIPQLRAAAFIRGFMSTMGGGIETASKFGELLKEEFSDEENPNGRIPTAEELVVFVQNEEKFNKFRNKALLKGATITAVDNFGGGIVAKSVAKTAKKGRKVAATTKGLVGETITGGGGEALSSVVIGEEINATDVGLEILGQGGQATVDIGGALITPGSFKVNGDKASLKQVNKILETATTEELAKIDIEVKNNNALKNEVNEKQNDAILETQVDAKIEDVADRKKMVDLEKQRVKAEADVKKKGIQAVPSAKETLESIEMQMNEIVGKYTAIDGRTKDVRARKKTAEQVRENIADKNFETNLEFAKKHSKLYGLEVEDNLTQDQIKEKYGDELAGSLGGIVDDKLVINKKLAKTRVYGDNVANHELLHGIIKASGQKIKQSTINNFLNLIGEKNAAVIQKRIDDNYDAKYMADTPDEYFTIFSDAIANGEIQFNDNIFTKVKDVIRRTFADLGYAKVDFESAQGAYNFLKDYNKSIHKGALASGVVKATRGEGRVETPKFSKEASNKVQGIYEDKGVAGAMDIIEQFKPIVSRIAERRREAPNFDRELLMSEIEIGERGIFDLISKYDPDSGVPLAAYINKFLPSRAIEASRRVLGEEFTEDVSERVDIAAEEVADVEVEAKPKKKKIVLAERLGITDKVAKAVKKIIPDLDVSGLTIKTLKNQVPSITGELFGISPKKIKSGANITKPELQSAQMFINKNADLLMAMLPEGATPGGTATGVPQTLLKAFYTKTDRAKMAKTGTKAGLAIQQKNKINKTEFLEVFGIIEGKPVRTDRNTSARVLALANQLGKMITNQTVRQELAKKPDTKKDVSRIAEGKSEVLFSKSVDEIINIRSLFELETKGIDKLLKTYGIDKTFNLRKEKGREDFVKAIEETLLPLMPRDFWFGPDSTVFTASNKTYGLSMSTTDGKRKNKNNRYKNPKEAKAYNNLRDKLKGLRKLDDSKFGKPIMLDGKEVDFKVSSYDTMFGDAKKIKSKIKNGDIEAWNKKVALIHKEMWKRFNNAINQDGKINKNTAAAIGTYLKLVGSDTNHWHKLGAQFVGYSDKITGKRFEYEHAMPATAAYLYLMDAVLSDSNFNASYNAVIDNYKLIALDKAMDIKLTSVGLQRRMPEGWDLMQNNWWDRYFNDLVNNVEGGIDPASIIGLEGKTFGEMFGVKKPITKPNLNKTNTLNKAGKFSRSSQNETKGITVLDFDDTLATSKSLVISTSPEGVVRKLTAEEFAQEGADLLDQGWTHDFSEFSKVVDGKVASLFKKAMKLQGKFGPENMFVLTARPADSAPAIFEFLKANGLNIPLKNITGLANSTPEAKALWIADKVGEGFNDFYFADDALQNVQAVKNMLDQFDVKSKVQQAKVKFSKSMNDQFNDILENVTGIESGKRFSIIKGRKRGEGKGKFRFFIPPSHEDFVGLLYNFIGKGKEGNKHRDFFEQALIRPLNRAYREIDTAKQAIANDYKSLNEQFSEVKDKLTKITPDGDFTFQDAIRVYLWNKHGYKIPGLTTTDQQSLVDLVVGDPELQAYAETLNVISKQEKYVDPGQNWETGNIRIDLVDATGRVGRKEYFAEFNENAEIMFSEENLNKIEAAYGKDFRDALEDMLYRIGTGINRPKGSSAKPNIFMNWLNASVSGVMFFNTRSALLQQMSNVNFLNFADNNVLAAGKAFANQPQYWKDFAMIFNSDMLKQRRGGIQTDINGAELAEAIKKARPGNMFDQVSIIVGKALKLGFLPTQIGDNIAIATGGAAFYRNRVNKNIKDGMSIKEAEAAAFTDLQNITQSTQQSARPDMTSKQQASWIGKLVLNFLNTPSQYNRIIKKAGSDILNRRITPPNTTQMQSDMSNMSRILYYGAAQNLIFYGLQTALFAVMFGMEDDDEEKRAEQFLKKKERVINGSIDTILRGSGIYGVAVSTLKNMIIKFAEQREKGYNKDESAVIMELANFSPVVGIKLRKIVNAEKTLNYNKKVIDEMETFDIDNPQWSAVTNYVESITTAPVNRLYQKTINLRNASDNQYTAFQRALFLSGYTTWSLNLGDTEKMKQIKEKTKNKKKTNTRSRTRTRTRSRTRTR